MAGFDVISFNEGKPKDTGRHYRCQNWKYWMNGGYAPPPPTHTHNRFHIWTELFHVKIFTVMQPSSVMSYRSQPAKRAQALPHPVTFLHPQYPTVPTLPLWVELWFTWLCSFCWKHLSQHVNVFEQEILLFLTISSIILFVGCWGFFCFWVFFPTVVIDFYLWLDILTISPTYPEAV